MQQSPPREQHRSSGSMSGRPTTAAEAWGCKGDVEGSRPRQYKPGIRLNAPPGGGGSFTPDWDPEAYKRHGGKKLFPGAGGAGSYRDTRGIETNRYYQDVEDRPGKQRAEQGRPQEQANARDSHRYYLAGDDRADRVPGKAQCSPPSAA